MKYVKVYYDLTETIDELSDAEAGRLLKALLEYGATGEVRALSGQERFVFKMVKAQMDRDRRDYAARAERNRENGLKGGRPAKPTGFMKNPEKPTGLQKNPEKPTGVHNKDKEVYIADAIYAHTRESGGGFLDDDEADDLMGELNSVLDAAHDAGFPDNQATFDRLTALCADYTAAWVLEALKVCVDRGQSSPGYLAGVLQRYREQGGLDSQRKQETYTPNRLVIDDAPQADRAKLAALADKARAMVEKQRALPQ